MGHAVVALSIAVGVWLWLPERAQARQDRRGRRGAVARRSDAVSAPGEDRDRPLPDLDLAVLLSLARAALAAGAAVPTVLVALGECGGGRPLVIAGRALLLGASWDEATAEVPPRLSAVLDALAPAWQHGADPDSLLIHAMDVVRVGRQRAAQVAAARLGVRLVLPLGLCFLPAFVTLGLVPIVMSFLGDLLSG